MEKKLAVMAACLIAVVVQAAPAAPLGDDFTLAPSKGLAAPVPLKIENVLAKPVLTRGAPTQWDAVDVLNPSVVRLNGKLFNYYSGYDGKVWRTGIATSSDGIVWRKFDSNPVLQPDGKSWDVSYIAANGAAIVWKGKILYFYQGRDKSGRTQIGLATSSDGFKFTNYPKPVFATGASHTWDSQAVGDPYVIAKDGYLYLYYLGQDEIATQRLGVARSSDGVTWQRSPANPILDVGAYGAFDENGLGEPSVAYAPPYFYMLYTGRSNAEIRNLGYAVSTDGIHWKKMSIAGLITDRQRAAWNLKVICDSTLLSMGNGNWAVWFGGGDKAEPAQNLNGEVGMMTVDLTQGRNVAEFDANADWDKTPIRSTDVVRGSFPIEGDPGKRHAWVGPSTFFTFPIEQTPSDKSLLVSGWVPAATIAKTTKMQGSDRISVVVNGAEVASKKFIDDDVFTISVPLKSVRVAARDADYAEVEIRASRSMVPAEAGSSPDTRRLAFTLTSIKTQ